jgi:hypothetical protein
VLCGARATLQTVLMRLTSPTLPADPAYPANPADPANPPDPSDPDESAHPAVSIFDKPALKLTVFHRDKT